MKPALLLDVDGPLNPDAKPHRRPDGYTTHRMRPTGFDHPHVKPLRVWLNPSHGPELLALPYELVWCTTWAADANTWIAPVLGLPDLPYVPWPADAPRPTPRHGTHWKTQHVVTWARGRPFVWVDDETTEYDTDYLTRHHDGFSRILHVNPRLGLRENDFATLQAWAREATSGVG